MALSKLGTGVAAIATVFSAATIADDASYSSPHSSSSSNSYNEPSPVVHRAKCEEFVEKYFKGEDKGWTATPDKAGAHVKIYDGQDKSINAIKSEFGARFCAVQNGVSIELNIPKMNEASVLAVVEGLANEIYQDTGGNGRRDNAYFHVVFNDSKSFDCNAEATCEYRIALDVNYKKLSEDSALTKKRPYLKDEGIGLEWAPLTKREGHFTTLLGNIEGLEADRIRLAAEIAAGQERREVTQELVNRYNAQPTGPE